VRVHSGNAQETEALGAALARTRPGEGPLAVVYLTGALGSGKTTFARGFVSGCGIAAPVRSPTYTLLETYEAGALTILHADLYRLEGAADTESLGLRDFARPGCLWLVEWPERGQGGLPEPDLTLRFTAGTAGHDIELTAATAAGSAWIARLEGTLATRS